MNNYKTFEPGQKVKNNHGKVLTILFQRGCQVFVVEESFGWYHPSKLWLEQEGKEPEH